jgi:hypothetical protein
MNKVTIQLSGDAKNHFDKIHHFLENEKLSITARYTALDVKYDGIMPEKWTSDDLVTLLMLVGNEDVQKEVHLAVANINALYPQTAQIL